MASKTREDFLYLVKSYLNVRGVATSGCSKSFPASEMNLLIMSNAEQKQSLVNDYNKQLDEDGVTETLKVAISERINNKYDWPRINLDHIFLLHYKNQRFSES